MHIYNCYGAAKAAAVAIAVSILMSCGMVAAVAAESPAAKSDTVIVNCKADLAARQKVQPASINIIKVQPTVWPNAALGMPEAGKVYAEVQTPGFRIILEAKGTQYLYTTSDTTFKYGGPTSIWLSSMLYIKPVLGEPNLNGDLYQCSLLGTNTSLIIKGVADYDALENGIIVAKERLSRSSHRLFMLKASEPAKTKTLYSAFDFGHATINAAENQWAAFVRPMVGGSWVVATAPLTQENTHVQTIALPEGVVAGKIAFVDDQLMILVSKGQGRLCFTTTPQAKTPEWKEAPDYMFPGANSFMLNKSQTLEVTQVTKDDKLKVTLDKVWFTGDRDPIAEIDNLRLGSYDLLPDGYVFVTGSIDNEQAAYTVSIWSGEIFNSFKGSAERIKAFKYPVANGPIDADKIRKVGSRED